MEILEVKIHKIKHTKSCSCRDYAGHRQKQNGKIFRHAECSICHPYVKKIEKKIRRQAKKDENERV